MYFVTRIEALLASTFTLTPFVLGWQD